MKKAKKTFKKFEDWLPADIRIKPGVIQTLSPKPMQDWLDVSGMIPQE
jgi:hypothetical protein